MAFSATPHVTPCNSSLSLWHGLGRQCHPKCTNRPRHILTRSLVASASTAGKFVGVLCHLLIKASSGSVCSLRPSCQQKTLILPGMARKGSRASLIAACIVLLCSGPSFTAVARYVQRTTCAQQNSLFCLHCQWPWAPNTTLASEH